MTRQNRLLLGVLVLLGVAAAYWFLLLAPKREEAAALADKVAQTEAAVRQAEATLASYREAAAAYPRLSTTVARLGKAVPADDDVRSLMVQLESAADAAAVDFRSIKAGAAPTAAADAAAAGAQTKPVPPGATPVGSAGFSSMAFNLEFNGDYLRLSRLFSRLERFVRVHGDRIDVTGRLLRVEGVSMAPSSGDYRDLKATVTASTYLVPATEGLAGATPPAATAPPAQPGGTTPPTTTATTTGALR